MRVDDAASKGPADVDRHVIGRHSTEKSRVPDTLDDMASYVCSSIARHVIGFSFTQVMTVQTSVDDVAGRICLSFIDGRGGSTPGAEWSPRSWSRFWRTC
jgi:hypothetical protein